MNTFSNISVIDSIVREYSNAAILTVLLDGRFHPVSYIAYRVSIKVENVRYHLGQMLNAKLITVEKQGRHKYYGITNQRVAQEILSRLSNGQPIKLKPLKVSREKTYLQNARTCYDHLAGKLGVKVRTHS